MAEFNLKGWLRNNIQPYLKSISTRVVPAGGTTGQQLAKTTDNDHDVGWVDSVKVSPETVVEVFDSTTERDAETPYTGMLTLQLDTDTYTLYDGTSWSTYTGVVPFYYIGTPLGSAVDGHIPNGAIYSEIE